MEVTPATVVDDVAFPLPSAVTFVRGCTTAPWFVHDPTWMCAAWALFGARPDMVILTVSCPLANLTSAVPDAACDLSLIHISEPTRLGMISYAVFCLKKKKKKKKKNIYTQKK